MPIDYMTLRLIWWTLLGVLLIGFAIMDGFDLGVAMLHPFVPRNDRQRRVLLNTIGPVWEGNQVWFILGGGAVFAASPPLYASFSGFLLPSSTRPDHSRTVWDSSSSQMTLTLMLAAVVIFLPIVLAYTSWAYYVLRGPVTETAIERQDDYYY